MMTGCGAPTQTAALPAGVNAATETVISGTTVRRDGTPVPGAYVRLLDDGDEFTAEVVTSREGYFRFFAAPGTWTLSAISRDGTARTLVRAAGAGVVDANLVLT